MTKRERLRLLQDVHRGWKQKREANMGKSVKNDGACDQCGKQKKVGAWFGKMLCLTCMNLASKIRNNRDAVAALYSDIHGEPPLNSRQAGAGGGTVGEKILLGCREALGWDGNITDMPQQIREMVAQLETAAADIDYRSRLLDQVQGILGDSVYTWNDIPEQVQALTDQADQPEKWKDDAVQLADICDILGDQFGPDESPAEAVRRLIEDRLASDSADGLVEIVSGVAAILERAGHFSCCSFNELPGAVQALVDARSSDGADQFRVPDGYEPLMAVFVAAVDQAANGKGRVRHAVDGVPFVGQESMCITRDLGLAYPIGQARKKAGESLRLGKRGPAELLGAMVYLAMAHIAMREQQSNVVRFPAPAPDVEYAEGVGHD